VGGIAELEIAQLDREPQLPQIAQRPRRAWRARPRIRANPPPEPFDPGATSALARTAPTMATRVREAVASSAPPRAVDAAQLVFRLAAPGAFECPQRQRRMPANTNLLAIDVQKPGLGFDREVESGFEANGRFGSFRELAGEHVDVDLGPSLEELFGWGSVMAWIVGSGESSWHGAPWHGLAAQTGCKLWLR